MNQKSYPAKSAGQIILGSTVLALSASFLTAQPISPYAGLYKGVIKFRGQVAGSTIESNAMWLSMSVDNSGNLVTETIGTPAIQTTVRYLPYVRGIVDTNGTITLSDGAPFTPGMFDPLPKPDTQVSGSVMKITSRDNTISAGGYSVSQRYSLLATNISPIPSNAAPRINFTSPGSTNVYQGLTLALYANCIYWSGPVTAQWRKYGVDIPGATNIFGFDTGYVKAGMTYEDAGAYSVVLSNPYGSVTSSIINITVSAAPPLAPGGADPSFNGGAGPGYGIAGNVISGLIYAMAPMSDGRVIVGGFWDRWDNKPNAGLARLNGDGSLDTNFVAGLTNVASPTNHVVSAIALQEDGKIVLSWLGGISRLNSDGSRDLTFSNLVINPRQIIIQPDGKILVANFASGLQSLGRLNPDGSWDRSFARGRDYFTGYARHIILQPDGKIVVFGRPQYRDGNGMDQYVSSDRIFRLNNDGTLDSSFVAGVTPNDTDEAAVTAVGLQPDGHIVIGGLMGGLSRSYGGKTNIHGLLRLNANGSFDSTFKTGDGICTKFVFPGNIIPPIYSCGSISSIYCQPDGKIFIGGAFLSFNGAGRTNFARLNADGSLDTAFNPAPAAPNADVQHIKPTLSGKLYLGGIFTKLGETPRVSVGRVAGSTPPPPDTKAPTIALVSPKGPTFISFSDSITVTGTASDDRELKRVFARIGDDAFEAINGTSTWEATFALQPGTNLIAFKATDASGNAATNKLTVIYKVSSPFDLVVNGLGTVTPNIDNTTQEIGAGLSLTATPAKGWLFSNWIVGAQIYLTPKISFAMQSNLTATANFVTNPFIASKAIFNGLVMDDAAPEHDRAGFISINLLDSGKYSGSLLMAGKKLSFVGTFDLSRQSTVSILAKPGTNTMLLNIALNNPGNAISGTLTDGRGPIPVNLNKTVFSKLVPATNLMGSFTLLAQPAEGEDIDIGDSFGVLKVDAAGTAALAGSLADGTTGAQKVALAHDGSWPFYIPLYSGKGSIFGWLKVSRDHTNAIVATNGVVWTRPTQAKQPYAAGFTNRFTTLGSIYLPPTTNRVLQFSNSVVILAEGNLSQNLTNDVVLGTDNKVVNQSSNKLTLTIAKPTGLIAGSLTPPTGGKPVPFKGAVLQNQNFGGGYFLGTNKTGQLYFGE